MVIVIYKLCTYLFTIFYILLTHQKNHVIICSSKDNNFTLFAYNILERTPVSFGPGVFF